MQPLTDLSTVHIQLNDLRSRFDLAMRQGKNFTETKIIYLQLKELERFLQADEQQQSGASREPGQVTVSRPASHVEYPSKDS